VTTIAELLHKAADSHLSRAGVGGRDKEVESCTAVVVAAEKMNVDYRPVWHGLQEMGVYTFSFMQFEEFPRGPERQAARYAWLKFAALIAEEQGV
jgi:hypothetical protein